ncbi:PEP-CTERM sorting domain-containing protein [Planctomycetota bacterium]
MKTKGSDRVKRIWSVGLIISLCFCILSSNLYAVPVTIDIHVNGGKLYGDSSISTDIDWDEVYANPDQPYTWWMQEPIIITADSNPEITLATIEGINIAVKADPMIELGFAVAAGDHETYFSFTSEVLTFAPITNPDARAYAAISTGLDDTLTGNYEFGTKAYEALYNGDIVFAHLVDPVTSGVGSENTGWQQIAGDVSSMQAKWWFHVSPYGTASGSSTFEVTPEPTTIALLGMGGLVLLRRRKRK